MLQVEGAQLLGPAYGPISKERPEFLVVLLHGYGSNGDDLISMADVWAPRLPSTLFVSPNAPFPCETNPFGYQWFGLQDFNSVRIWHEIEVLIPVLGSFIQALMKKHALTWDRVALVGFSQGAMLTFATSLAFFPVCAAVGYSGILLASFSEHAKFAPPVCLIHGDRDEVVPLECFQDAQRRLEEIAIIPETWLCKGLGHTISPFGLEKGLAFLERYFDDSKKNTSNEGRLAETRFVPSSRVD